MPLDVGEDQYHLRMVINKGGTSGSGVGGVLWGWGDMYRLLYRNESIPPRREGGPPKRKGGTTNDLPDMKRAIWKVNEGGEPMVSRLTQ